MTNTTTKFDKDMDRDAAILLYGNAFAGLLITFITSTFLVFAFTYPSVEHFTLDWWFVMTFVLLVRLVDVVWWKIKLQDTEFDGRRSVLFFVTGANITAVLWAIYLVHSTTMNEDIEVATTIIAIASMAGGSVAVLTAHKFTVMFFPLILLLPGSISLLLSDKYNFQLLGVLGISFTLVIIVIARKSADFTRHTLFLKNQNANLILRMEEKVKQRTQKIYELSNLDPLTHLYNRTAFLNQLKQLTTTNSSPFALLFIDLDGFKKINDSIGHKAGDEILRKTAERLKVFMLNSPLLCRWGGDEFLVIFEEHDPELIVKNAKQLIDVLSQPIAIENSILSVGATIGVALYPQQANTEERLIQFADMAMYYQKKQMRSTVGIFSEQMEKLYSYELHLKNGLSKAIEMQQLRLVYQPILSAQGLNVVSFEALLRWQIDGENIPPDNFIGIAEQYGLIHEVGAWVLQTACAQATQWQSEQSLAICVNVSVIQLQDAGFINIVKDALNNSKLVPERLYIEITESVFASDIVFIEEQIKQLQTMGIKVSIDDFGTGYSSLSVMQNLAVNMVKIDKSFVDNIDCHGGAIISAVMHIAATLGFSVVAEGVETDAQADALLKLGVHYVQGYKYSKPIESKQVNDYLQSNFNLLSTDSNKIANSTE